MCKQKQYGIIWKELGLSEGKINMIISAAQLRVKKGLIVGASIVVGAYMALAGVAAHAVDSSFNQTISAGTLATEILDGSRATVASPSVTMSGITFSFDCQEGGSASTGTFGTTSERIYVSNPDAADNGWTLGLAATGGNTSFWDGAGADFDFNDPTGATQGCEDGGDTDSLAGQLAVDPSGGTITADCGSCTTTNVSQGSSSAFNEGSTDSINLLTAASGSDDIWRGYLTGVGLSQTIPAETPADSYSIDLTVTVTAS